MPLPEKSYERLHTLWKRWDLPQEDIYYAVESGLLQTCVWMPLRVMELGIIGLLLVAGALALLLRRLHAAFPAREPAQAAIYATVIAYLGAGFSSFSIWQNWWVALVWILLLLWRYLLPRGLHSPTLLNYSHLQK